MLIGISWKIWVNISFIQRRQVCVTNQGTKTENLLKKMMFKVKNSQSSFHRLRWYRGFWRPDQRRARVECDNGFLRAATTPRTESTTLESSPCSWNFASNRVAKNRRANLLEIGPISSYNEMLYCWNLKRFPSLFAGITTLRNYDCIIPRYSRFSPVFWSKPRIPRPWITRAACNQVEQKVSPSSWTPKLFCLIQRVASSESSSRRGVAQQTWSSRPLPWIQFFNN